MIQLLHWQKPNEVYVKGFLNSIRSLFLLFIYMVYKNCFASDLRNVDFVEVLALALSSVSNIDEVNNAKVLKRISKLV